LNKWLVSLNIYNNIRIQIFHGFRDTVAAAFMVFYTHHRFTAV